ncbi:hypothetical protein MSAN_01633300 [Mycena sanguinolenta]|uniref:DUF6532 domain-containing protein n=1 Tax=Mycena sanguinolenta TaxID=230812 RepID=A0A8H6Y2Q0_9AGAR|nr:hypothetical protein MSAN_01633300 [Mycena sanguinolenta]
MGSSNNSKKSFSKEAASKKDKKTSKKPADSEKRTDGRAGSKRKRQDFEDDFSGKENGAAEGRPQRKKISTLETMHRVSQNVTHNPPRSKAQPMPEEEEINVQAPPQNGRKKHVSRPNIREDSPLRDAPLPSKEPVAPMKVHHGNITLRLQVGAATLPTTMPAAQLRPKGPTTQTAQRRSPPAVKSVPKPRPANKGARNPPGTNMDIRDLMGCLKITGELSDTELSLRKSSKAKAKRLISSDDENDYDSGGIEEGEHPEEPQRQKEGGGNSSNNFDDFNNDFDNFDDGADFNNSNNSARQVITQAQGNQGKSVVIFGSVLMKSSVVQPFRDLFEEAQQNLLNKQRQQQEKVRLNYFQNFQPQKNIQDVDYRQQEAEDSLRRQQEDEMRRKQVEEDKRRRQEEATEEQRSKDQRGPAHYTSDDEDDADRNIPYEAGDEDQDDQDPRKRGEVKTRCKTLKFQEKYGNTGPKGELKLIKKAQIQPLSLKNDNRQQLAGGAQGVLEKHHAKNKPALIPSGKHLSDCRQQQHRAIRIPTDSEEDSSDEDNGDNEDEDDDDEDSDSGDSGKKKRKTRTQNKEDPPSTQEAFYPRPWRKVLAAVKPAVAKYLLLKHFFPEQEIFVPIIVQYIEEAIWLYEQQVDALDRYYYKHHKDDMAQLLWGFVSTFRGRCKDIARDIVRIWFLERIYPDEKEFGESFSQDKYVEKTIENVQALLHKGKFLEDGLDEQAIFILGRTNNLMSPAIADMCETVLTKGKHPLYKEYDDEELLPPAGEYYHPNLVAAMTVLLRCAIEEYSSGSPIKIYFRHKTYLPVYARALENMHQLEKDPYHFSKTTGRWIQWVKCTRAKRIGLQETFIAGEDVMALTLD